MFVLDLYVHNFVFISQLRKRATPTCWCLPWPLLDAYMSSLSGGALVYVHVYLTLHHCILSVCSFTLIWYTCRIHTTKQAIFHCIFQFRWWDYLLGYYTSQLFTEGWVEFCMTVLFIASPQATPSFWKLGVAWGQCLTRCILLWLYGLGWLGEDGGRFWTLGWLGEDSSFFEGGLHSQRQLANCQWVTNW